MRIGVVVLFFGVAFLLKYAAEHDLVPIEIRLAAVAAGAIALLVFGWRLREQRSGYALMLQGGGIGVLYLTVFAALRLYQLLPPTFAFVVLAGIAVFSAALSVLQDSRSLAITGAAGGFLAPVLTSTGGGSHVALFSFYALLDAGILAIAMHKAWRELNLVGFAFTFVIGLAWGAQYYRPELYATTEPFLVLFFLFYVAIAVLFALRQAPRLAHYVDGTLVFGTPLIAFGLQTALVRDMEFGAAWSAFALAAFYLSLATDVACPQAAANAGPAGRIVLRARDRFRDAGRAARVRWPSDFGGVGGRRRRHRVDRRAPGAHARAAFWHGAAVGRRVCVSARTAGRCDAGAERLLSRRRHGERGRVCSAAATCNRTLRVTEGERIAARLLFLLGVAWWFGAGLLEIDRYADPAWGRHPQLLFFAASCGLFGYCGGVSTGTLRVLSRWGACRCPY